MNTLKNKVSLIGNLGATPEVREVATGRKVARMVVATHSTTRNAAGERDTNTQWHTVVAWGRTAEQVERLLEKGSPVALEGKLVHRSYAGRDGRTRHISEIVMNEFQLLPSLKRAAKAA
ncbi:MAG: single-stranded DNA-binding protein [Flavobacteriales bacterium]|jgi:single-strand DNA-binding protein